MPPGPNRFKAEKARADRQSDNTETGGTSGGISGGTSGSSSTSRIASRGATGEAVTPPPTPLPPSIAALEAAFGRLHYYPTVDSLAGFDKSLSGSSANRDANIPVPQIGNEWLNDLYLVSHGFLILQRYNGADWVNVGSEAGLIDALNGQTVQDALNALRKGSDTPFVIVSTGQSNAAGANSGGLNPANSRVHVWDGTTADWGSSDFTLNPFARTTPDGNSANNNMALAMAHRVQEFTGREVFVVFDAVGGKSIDEWTITGVTSTRYAAIRAKVSAALASSELTGKTTVDAIHWQQGEEDALTHDFETYYGKFQTLIAQFRAETWATEQTPILVGAPSQQLHSRYQPKAAMRQFCNKDDSFALWINSAGLETSDNTHYTGSALFEMGWDRMFQAWLSGPYLSEVEQSLFYGRGIGPALPSNRQQIASASSLVSWDSKTNDFPPNSSSATGSIAWGGDCDADGNYTFVGGLENSSDNLSNYSFIWGREITSGEFGDYGGAFGFQNQLINTYTFVAGRGNIPADSGGAVVGLFSKYTVAEADPVMFQVGIGTSTSNRKNALTVRSSGTTEIYAPSTAADPTQNEEITFKRVDDTTLKVSMRGADGTVRSVDLTLA